MRVALLAALGAVAAACGLGYETPGGPDPNGVGPPPPSGVGIEPGTSVNAIRLKWSTVATAQTYNIYWGTTPDLTLETATKITGVISPFVHTNRTPGTTYYYMIVSVNADGDEGLPTTIISGRPQQTIELNVESPAPGALTDNPLQIVVEYDAPVLPGPMSATIAGVNGTLTYDASISRFTGTVDLSAVTSPSTHRLVITANGPASEVAEATVSVRFDRKPVLDVFSPGEGANLTPSTRIFATCTDDATGGCVSLAAYVAGTPTSPFISGVGEINAILLELVAGYNSGPLAIVIDARDSSGQLRRATRTVILP